MGLSWLCGVLADYRGLLGEGCVGFDESGLIRRVSREAPPGGVVRDYRGRGYIVAPGLVDIHVHLRGLELSYKETGETGCMAAASSGITLVVDMPNTKPPLKTPEALDRKLGELDSKCVVDHGVYAGIPGDPGLVGGGSSFSSFICAPSLLRDWALLHRQRWRENQVRLQADERLHDSGLSCRVPRNPLASQCAHRRCY